MNLKWDKPTRKEEKEERDRLSGGLREIFKSPDLKAQFPQYKHCHSDQFQVVNGLTVGSPDSRIFSKRLGYSQQQHTTAHHQPQKAKMQLGKVPNGLKRSKECSAKNTYKGGGSCCS